MEAKAASWVRLWSPGLGVDERAGAVALGRAYWAFLEAASAISVLYLLREAERDMSAVCLGVGESVDRGGFNKELQVQGKEKRRD